MNNFLCPSSVQWTCNLRKVYIKHIESASCETKKPWKLTNPGKTIAMHIQNVILMQYFKTLY